MSNLQHIIRTQRLDLHLHDVQNHVALQNRVAGLMQSRINQKIGDLFSELFGDDHTVLRLPQLLVDIGSIDERQLDQELEERILHQLRMQLMPFRQRLSGSSKSTDLWKPVKDKELHLLEFFLLHGTLPWWAGERHNMQDILNGLLSNNAAALSRMLKRIGRYAGVVKRLVNQFSEESIFSIIRVVEPAEAAFIIEYARGLSEAHRRKPLVTASTREFDKARLEFILIYIFSDRGTAFNRKAFVQFTLGSLAARYSLAYHELLGFLVNELQRQQLVYLPSALKDILTELAAAEANHVGDTSSSSVNELKQQLRFLDHDSIHLLLEAALQNSTLPAKLAHLQGLLQGESLRLLLQTYQEEALEMAERLPSISAVARQLLEVLGKGKKENELRGEALAADSGKRGAPTDKVFPESDMWFVLQYIKTGSLPRSAYRWDKARFIEKLQEVMRKAPRPFRVALRKLPAPTFSARVIAHTLPQPVVEQVVQVLEPADGREIIHLTRQVAEVQKQETVFETGTTAFEPVLWEFVLAFLLKQNATRYNRKTFARHLLVSLAHRYNIEYSALLKVILSAIAPVEQVQTRKNELVTILKELQYEEPIHVDMPQAELHQPADIIAGKALLYFLQYGALPWWAVQHQTQPADFLQKALNMDSERYRLQLLTLLHTHTYAAQRLLSLLKGSVAQNMEVIARLLNVQFEEAETEIWHLLVAVILEQEIAGSPQPTSERSMQHLMLVMLKNGTEGKTFQSLQQVFFHALQSQLAITEEAWTTVLEKLSKEAKPGAKARQLEQVTEIVQLMLRQNKLMVRDKQMTDTIIWQDDTNVKVYSSQLPAWMLELINDFPSHKEWFFRSVYTLFKATAWSHPNTGIANGSQSLHFAKQLEKAGASGQDFLSRSEHVPALLLRQVLMQLVRQKKSGLPLPVIKKIIRQLTLADQTWYTFTAESVEALLMIPEIKKDEAQHEAVLWVAVAEQVVNRSAFNRHNMVSSMLQKMAASTAYTAEQLIQFMISELSSGTVSGKRQELLNVLFSLLKDKRHILLRDKEKAAREQKLAEEQRRREAREKAAKAAAEEKERQAAHDANQLAGEEDFGQDNSAAGNNAVQEARLKGNDEITETDETDLMPGNAGEPGGRNEAGKRKQGYTKEELAAQKKREREQALQAEKKQNKPEAEKDAEQIELPEKEGVYVYNAGLVLLQPYVARLLSKLELTEGPRFKNEASAERAVHILEFLASGQEEVPEYDLVLNKVMCGIPVSQPVDREIKLTETEKEICNGLLKAVINNWAVIKNTSVDGLRQSFLLRKGKLVSEEKIWELAVEKKGYDVLIDKLPWSYNPVHFHWMEKPIYVKWR